MAVQNAAVDAEDIGDLVDGVHAFVVKALRDRDLAEVVLGSAAAEPAAISGGC